MGNTCGKCEVRERHGRKAVRGVCAPRYPHRLAANGDQWATTYIALALLHKEVWFENWPFKLCYVSLHERIDMVTDVSKLSVSFYLQCIVHVIFTWVKEEPSNLIISM